MGDILSARISDFHSNSSSFRGQKKRSQSFDSNDNGILSNPSSDPWGWFDDFENNLLVHYPQSDDGNPTSSNTGGLQMHKTLSLPLPKSNPPAYVLESSVETQHLWYETAGQRPQQPQHEREYFESLWKTNFEASSVDYSKTVKLDEINSKYEDENYLVDGYQGQIVSRGGGPFSISVSKSFENNNISCVTLQMPSYRIVRLPDGIEYAEFLVVVTFSNIQSISLGIWRRHSHFADLVRQINLLDDGTTTYRNTLLSWQCLLNRKRWYKCLEKGYLSLKCFLLERFMHDFLFESPTPNMISDFLGLEP